MVLQQGGWMCCRCWYESSRHFMVEQSQSTVSVLKDVWSHLFSLFSDLHCVGAGRCWPKIRSRTRKTEEKKWRRWSLPDRTPLRCSRRLWRWRSKKDSRERLPSWEKPTDHQTAQRWDASDGQQGALTRQDKQFVFSCKRLHSDSSWWWIHEPDLLNTAAVDWDSSSGEIQSETVQGGRKGREIK